MFDIGFWEMGLIGVVALLVIGPERLPAVARTAGMWIGRMRGFVGSVQADLNQEIGKAEQLKQLLEEQTKIKSAHEIIEDTANQVRESLSVPAAKPDYLLKAEPTAEPVSAAAADTAAVPKAELRAESLAEPGAEPDQTPAAKPTQASRAVAAAQSPVTRAATPATDAPKEPAKADDVKHDQSA